MKTYVQDGANVTVTAPYAVTSGQGVQVGALFGVANTDAANGAPVEITMRHVFSLTKAAGQAVTQGARLYWDNTARVVTTTASGNQQIGVATEAALAGSATVTVRLPAVV